MAYRLQALESRLRVRERKHPKLYWIDPGVVRAIKKHSGRLTREERGPLLEGWIALLLKAYGDVRGIFDDMFYWAPAEARYTEVDFILKRGAEHLAIEVKSGANVSSQDLSGLKAVADLPRLVRRILIYGGKRAMKTGDGINICSVEQFLQALATGRLWP